MNSRALMVLSALLQASGMGLHANDGRPVLQLDFGQEESAPLIAVGGVVRDQTGPRPPEFQTLRRTTRPFSCRGKARATRSRTRERRVRSISRMAMPSRWRRGAKWHDQDKRISAYKEAEITDIDAHDLVIRATDVGVCSNRLIPPVLHEWREPRHDAFEGRNVWSLFNAFTESLKEGNLAELPKRTEALNGLLDTHVGLSA